MASAAPTSLLEQFRTAPLRGNPLAGVTLAMWLAGAIYCSGYERLLSGLDNWPDSLLWSAVAVLPWLALFEWSKSEKGRQQVERRGRLALLLVTTAALSLLLEVLVNRTTGAEQASLALALLRRLPAIAFCLLLILWARAGMTKALTDKDLPELASSIELVSAADNYIELHIGGRIVMRRMTMREAERALAGRGFVRIHRRYLVKRKRIEAVVGNGSKKVKLTGGVELPVGSRYAANLGRNI